MIVLGLTCMQDLVPWPGIKPGPPALGIWSLNHLGSLMLGVLNQLKFISSQFWRLEVCNQRVSCTMLSLAALGHSFAMSRPSSWWLPAILGGPWLCSCIPPVSAWIITWPSPCMTRSVFTRPSYKDISHWVYREGTGDPLQYSCLENPMDRGAWQATVHGVARVRHDLATKPLLIQYDLNWTINNQTCKDYI